jgi:hypothetical protein
MIFDRLEAVVTIKWTRRIVRETTYCARDRRGWQGCGRVALGLARRG